MKKSSLAGFLLLCLSGCRKSDVRYFPIEDPVLRKAATMKEGSYFVYKDSASGLPDSFWVYHYYNHYFTSQRAPQQALEEIFCNMKDTGSNTIHLNASTSRNALKSNFNGLESVLLTLPFPAGTEESQVGLFGYTRYFSYRQLHDTFTVFNQHFSNVYEIYFRSISPDLKDTQFLHSYYSPDDGLVKFSIKEKGRPLKTAELIRSHIIR